MAMAYIGIDPGKGGGLAVLDTAGQVKALVKMPETERDLLDFLDHYRPFLPVALLEKVWSQPSQGHTGAFTFGCGYGGLRMALVASQIPFDVVAPRKWQAAMQCLTKGDKNVSKRRAQELFPTTKVSHATADALLLAEYRRRLELRDDH